MRAPTRARVRTAFGRLILCTVPLLLSGCVTLRNTFSGYDTGANGIARPQERLRDAMARGDFKTALAWREDDALLRQLDVGIASYYAAQFERSASVFDSAALLADDRITASLSKDGLAMLANDLARPYQPRRTERLFIPYYAMLAYARLEQWEDAAVEARRLSSLLAQYAEDRDDRERTLHGALRELAGAVFERSGERGDAAVAYRAARALVPAFADADSGVEAPLPTADGRDSGEVLVVVERGYVAHRVTRTLELEVGSDGHDSLRLDDGGWRGAHRSAQPVGAALSVLPTYAPARHQHSGRDDDYTLTIAFPALSSSARPWGASVRAGVEGDTLGRPGVVAVLDDASAADARRESGAIARRAVGRAAVKYTAVKAVDEKKGWFAGRLANFGATLLERADVRSWHLLPREITLVRLRLPAGPQRVTLRVGEGAQARTVEAGTIRVRAGSVVLAPVRLWQAPLPAPVAPSEPLQPGP